MIQKRFLIFPLALILTSCNLYSSIDKPKGDEQLLSAARGCLDRGDYTCAKDYYQQLSNSYNDVKLSELSLTAMAEANAFSIRDLIDNLGSDRGGGSSFSSLAETMARRNKTDGQTRVLLISNYISDANISEKNLRAFMQFLTAFATFNQTLAAAVGADGKLTESDLVNNPTACRSGDSTSCALAHVADCARPSNSPLYNVAADAGTTDPTSTSNTTNWNTTPSLAKLRLSVTAAAQALNDLGNSDLKGILEVMNELDGIPDPTGGAATASCTRYAILTTLFE